jgi:O-antigen ligase
MNLAAKAMLQDSRTGIGWNNFAWALNPSYRYGDVIDDWERDRGHKVDSDYAKGVVESHYWLLLAETGYPGFAGYLLFIGITSWRCLRATWRGRGTFPGVFAGGLFAGVILIYAHSNFERVLTQTKNMSMWLILLGTAARANTWVMGRRIDGKTVRETAPAARSAVPAGGDH